MNGTLHNLIVSSLLVAMVGYVLMDRWQPLYRATVMLAPTADVPLSRIELADKVKALLVAEDRFRPLRGQRESAVFRRILPQDPTTALMDSVRVLPAHDGHNARIVSAAARQPYVAMRSVQVVVKALTGQDSVESLTVQRVVALDGWLLIALPLLFGLATFAVGWLTRQRLATSLDST